MPLTGLVILWLACARADAGEQAGPAPPANGRAPVASGGPKYLLFWEASEKAGELAERVGMKGDGKTRILGFGLPTPTFEPEEQLPGRIRSAFAAAREHDMAVILHFDLHQAWKHRPDLWNWFDPGKPGYNPDNKNPSNRVYVDPVGEKTAGGLIVAKKMSSSECHKKYG